MSRLPTYNLALPPEARRVPLSEAQRGLLSMNALWSGGLIGGVTLVTILPVAEGKVVVELLLFMGVLLILPVLQAVQVFTGAVADLRAGSAATQVATLENIRVYRALNGPTTYNARFAGMGELSTGSALYHQLREQVGQEHQITYALVSRVLFSAEPPPERATDS